MSFIETTKEGYNINNSDYEIKPIVKALIALIEKNGFDDAVISCGVRPSPDFGYFELAGRYWRASLCIYTMGATRCFWESGAGYSEPWLFNTRHAIELYIKGFILTAVWLEDLRGDPWLSTQRSTFEKLKKLFNTPHSLAELYNDYVTRISLVIKAWDAGSNLDLIDLNQVSLNSNSKQVLAELDEADKTSFRFRYPSLKHGDSDHLQEIAWRHDAGMLLPNIGLPKETGYFFDHRVAMNHIYDFVTELRNIVSYFDGYRTYQDMRIDEMGDYLNEYLKEYQGELGNEWP